MSVSIAIIFMILHMTLCGMDYWPALKCNGWGLESWLAVHLEKGSVDWRGKLGV